MRKSRKKKWQPKNRRRGGLKAHPMIRDFLVGTFGKVLQVVLVGAGIFVVISGLIDDPMGGLLISRIIGGVLCLCASFGIRYALGQIIRIRSELIALEASREG